ncbi:hypothetical protein [Bacteroides reticulotermitis]|uniref:Methylase-associated X1 domain-containing protein n=2 Tax=Bacteroides reticulotermitis TaxID=1133319 RepID=W4UYW2_9BACE|nr:hypothetical protein [Bacteroides reticulotermitis]MBB4046346.1 hypothetical protein [Bacteroides reticulotermitis]GAE86430.1 hypothetical protein JCM10512_4941 [Bacteroides reticulotermitis JCM 10512]GHV15008.1 hypothetical protein FACS1894169_05170 [Bacteroidia bacterium]GHV41909.1 hypothetical protein FACS1894179_10440 [Bacteroidia bacterium]
MNRIEKVYPETLLQLMLDVLKSAPQFFYIRGTQPFLMLFSGKEYYVYVKNMSSAYFNERPDTTRAQLPIREEFEEIKTSSSPFVFLGYDQENDVLICWNYHIVKTRLNERKSVSFYSRKFFQEEVTKGSFLQKRLKNGDEPILFKRKDLVEFFTRIETFFTPENEEPDTDILLFDEEKTNESDNVIAVAPNNPYVVNGKLLKITDTELKEQLKPIIQTNHMLQALKMAEQFYSGQFPTMKLKDWHELIKNIDFDELDEIHEQIEIQPQNTDIVEHHKIQYIDFMYSQNKSESIIRRYVHAVSGILTNLVKEYYSPQINSIFDTVNISMLQYWADSLSMRPDFREFNTLKHRVYSCALNKYIEYAESLTATEPLSISPKHCESLFMRFMQDSGLSENSGRYYIQALNGRVTECIRKYLMPAIQNIFSITDIQLLYSWSQFLHRNQDFKEMNNVGNRQYSCALSKYIQFVETLVDENTESAVLKNEGKRKSHILRVTYPNGRIVEERMVYKTLMDVISTAGAARVKSLGIMLNGTNLVSDTIIPRYEISQKPIGDELFVMTCSDTATKKSIIQQISNAFNMGLKIEEISII